MLTPRTNMVLLLVALLTGCQSSQRVPTAQSEGVPEWSAEMPNLDEIAIAVTGSVRDPGKFAPDFASWNVRAVLAYAGGVVEQEGTAHVQVIRATSRFKARYLTLSREQATGDVGGKVRLEPGDRIVVFYHHPKNGV